MGVHTAADLRAAEPEWIRQQFSVVMERTVRELRGQACLELEDIQPRQQSLCSRSFGGPVTRHRELQEAISGYTARAAEKLRRQHSVAGQLAVFIRTSPFREPYYSQGITVPLASPTADTLALTQAALSGLARIYKRGYTYQKAGVMLLDLPAEGSQPADLFADPIATHPKRAALMAAMDAINQQFGRNTVRLASSKPDGHWQMRQNRRSPGYTTEWQAIPSASAINNCVVLPILPLPHSGCDQSMRP